MDQAVFIQSKVPKKDLYADSEEELPFGERLAKPMSRALAEVEMSAKLGRYGEALKVAACSDSVT